MIVAVIAIPDLDSEAKSASTFDGLKIVMRIGSDYRFPFRALNGTVANEIIVFVRHCVEDPGTPNLAVVAKTG